MPVKRPLKQYKLSGRIIHTLDEFYDEIAKKLHFPDHFGRNLDALWDVLTTDMEGPLEIIWGNSADSRKSMKKDFGKVLSLLKEVEKERGDFHITIH